MKLLKIELRFILEAAINNEGVFDFENFSDKSFKLKYGISKGAARTLCEGLKTKVYAEMKRLNIAPFNSSVLMDGLQP